MVFILKVITCLSEEDKTMAGILLMAGDVRWIGHQCWMMIHRAAFGAIGKTYEVDHLTIKSKNMSLPENKRLNFHIWYDRNNSRIIKVSYSRMGNWEYRLKSIK